MCVFFHECLTLPSVVIAMTDRHLLNLKHIPAFANAADNKADVVLCGQQQHVTVYICRH